MTSTRCSLIDDTSNVNHDLTCIIIIHLFMLLIIIFNMFIRSSNGHILVITCEGNCGFYETGIMTTPMNKGYSVLGWNHPGFGGSTVSGNSNLCV